MKLNRGEKEASTELAIGQRMRSVRVRTGLTLEDVSERSGLGKAYLSRLERNLKSPSIAALTKICAALDIKLSSLVEEGADEKLLRVIRKKDRKHHLLQGDDESTVKSFSIVSPADQRRFLSLFVVKPTSKKVTRQGLSHSGEEVVVVLKGRVELVVGKDVIALDEGDCVHFLAQSEHSLRSLDRSTAEVLVITSPIH